MLLERIQGSPAAVAHPTPSAEATYWRMALESAGQGVWDYNIETGRKSYSETWYLIRGLTAMSTPPQSDEEWLALVHPDDRSVAAESTRRLNSGEISEVQFEYREKHASGHWVWIMCRGRAVGWGPDGLPSHFLGTDTDITQLKASEEELGRLSRRLELALSSGRIGVWQYDIEADKIEWDEELCKIYGVFYPTGEQPRDAWEKALHPDDKEWVLRQTARSFYKRSDYDMSYRIVRPDGETRFIRSRVSFQTSEAEPSLVVGVNWDATPEQEYALALEAANRHAAEQNQKLAAAKRAMEHSALHDALTGLPNRRLLETAHKSALRKRSRRGQRVAVLHLDLDRFKQINDAYGHAAGDSVLVAVAETLRTTVGTSGLVARTGGDEFAIFIEDAPHDHMLASLASSIIEACAAPAQLNGEECRYGVSVGIAAADASDAQRTTLFVDADMALYKAKKEGRGRYCFYTHSLKVAALLTKKRNDELLSALERSEFFCVYQAQYCVNTLALTGVEALVRWRHPTKGVLMPGDFLDAAVRLDVVHEVDQRVFSCVSDDLTEWGRRKIEIPRISLNICERRLHDPALISDIKKLLGSDTRLSLELLESNLLDDQAGIISEKVRELREIGVELEIDDFGTGHSSILSLLRIRPDRLKIDRALVTPIIDSLHHRQILKSIVEIGRTQEIAILAEGVESMEYLPLLQDLGCNEVQGFALARPMSANDLSEQLTRHRSNPRG
jgi:diguanylate cyclase (GGDEF)-like protein/PAS domain S-box-containing protein